MRLRLLADKIPELQRQAHAQRLEDIETLIVDHFSGDLTDGEKETLKLSRQLRNKILHCDFRAARNKLGELGFETQSGGVKKVKIAGLDGRQIAETIASVAANVPGTFDYVAESMPGPGGVFSWLLELGAAEDFVQGADAFAKSAAIIDRLAKS